MPDSIPQLLRRAYELRAAVASTPVVCSAEERLITMSMGVVVSACDRKNKVEVSLNQADAGLYAAKEKRPEPDRALHRCQQEHGSRARAQELNALL